MAAKTQDKCSFHETKFGDCAQCSHWLEKAFTDSMILVRKCLLDRLEETGKPILMSPFIDLTDHAGASDLKVALNELRKTTKELERLKGIVPKLHREDVSYDDFEKAITSSRSISEDEKMSLKVGFTDILEIILVTLEVANTLADGENEFRNFEILHRFPVWFGRFVVSHRMRWFVDNGGEWSKIIKTLAAPPPRLQSDPRQTPAKSVAPIPKKTTQTTSPKKVTPVSKDNQKPKKK